MRCLTYQSSAWSVTLVAKVSKLCLLSQLKLTQITHESVELDANISEPETDWSLSATVRAHHILLQLAQLLHLAVRSRLGRT